MTEASKIVPEQKLNTAVLFLVFSRLDTTRHVFEAIRQAKPPRLYVAADGARAGKEGEVEKVQAVRDFIMQSIDWECEVKTLFRDKNLGCKYAVSGAITWFFEHEEQGIILEDDCLPSAEFFTFCEDGLEKFKGDSNVSSVGGFVAFRHGTPFLNLHGSIWGWATWREKWKQYDIDATLDKEDEDFILRELPYFSAVQKINLSRSLKQNSVNTWDYYWLFTRIKNRWYTVLPGSPLISNIGFDVENSTHTKTAKPASLKKLENIKITKNDIDLTLLKSEKLKPLEKRRLTARFGYLRFYLTTMSYLLRNPSLLKATLKGH